MLSKQEDGHAYQELLEVRADPKAINQPSEKERR